MNEAEVRMHVIDPIVRQLGYKAVGQSDAYVVLEKVLKHPYFHIGRKSKKDLPLGRPDYICGIDGRNGCFTIEAKSSDSDITVEDWEQAHSYAAHSQVGASYFVLCNGRQFQVFETLVGKPDKPLLTLNRDEIDQNFHMIEVLLSPKNLARSCNKTYDLGLKLCDDLPSKVKISRGEYRVEFCEFDLEAIPNYIAKNPQFEAIVPPMLNQMAEQFKQFIFTVTNGHVFRDTTGKIVCDIVFGGITENSAKGMRAIGFDQLRLETDAQFLSTDLASATPFQTNKGATVTKGQEVFPLFGSPQLAELDMVLRATISANVTLTENNLATGDYFAAATYGFPALPDTFLSMFIGGPFLLELTC